jgi:hypothetical protein
MTFQKGFFIKSLGLPCSVCVELIPRLVRELAAERGVSLVLSGKYSLLHPRLFWIADKKMSSWTRVLLRMRGKGGKGGGFSADKITTAYPLNTFDYPCRLLPELQKELGLRDAATFVPLNTLCEVAFATRYLYLTQRGYDPYMSRSSTLIRSGCLEVDREGYLKSLQEAESAIVGDKGRRRVKAFFRELGISAGS